jgi:hypothetical protein
MRRAGRIRSETTVQRVFLMGGEGLPVVDVDDDADVSRDAVVPVVAKPVRVKERGVGQRGGG